MPKPEFTLKFIKSSDDLRRLSDRLSSLLAFALDIETIDWWNRHQERIALIQIAYRADDKIRVIIIDALADLDLEILRPPLEQASVLKIIHNAAFDAVRLQKHFNFKVAPVFDTMTAARRSGERKYSLKAQAEAHLGLHLNKSAQTSDWSRRPLDVRQLHYAALDPYATLLLYEHQTKRGLTGDYRLKPPIDSAQHQLPLDESPLTIGESISIASPLTEQTSSVADLSSTATALLGIVAELPTRYSPEALIVAVGAERVGVAGWIIDQRLGRDAEPDEETVKSSVADLSELNFVRITPSRRLEATEAGTQLWQTIK